MKTATQATKTTLSLVNVCCRILFFYFFWLASFDDGGTFTNRELAFINEMWAWQQKAFSNINIYTSECPKDWVILSTFNWPGTKEHIDSTDELIPAQAAQTFNKWTTAEFKNAFILCGQQLSQSFVDQAQSTETCESKSMKDCGITNQQFCVDSDTECPINGIEIVYSDDELSVQTTNINTKSDQMPLSLVRIDSYTPCATNNNTNTEKDVDYDENLDEIPQTCTTLDEEYIEINTVLDSLYFEVNNASNLYYDEKGTKTLYYKPYPYWASKCYGKNFLLAQDQANLLNQYKQLEYVNFVLVVLYLLICNYLIPMVPFIFRCVETLSYKNLVYIDYLFRIILSGVMTYLSFLSLGCGKAIEDNLDLLWGEGCIKDEDTTYGRFADQIDIQKALDIVAVTFSFILWSIEGSLLWVLGCSQTINKCRRKFKRQKIKKEMHLEQLEQSDIIQLN